jgi:predicted metal-binding membrane protein
LFPLSDRAHLALAVLFVALVCWLALLWLVFYHCHPLAVMTMPMSPTWSAGNALAVLVMWFLMMVAMMLPSAWPMVAMHKKMATRQGRIKESYLFASAYVLMWLFFSVAAVLLQWVFQLQKAINPASLTTSTTISVLLLLLAGLFQFSTLKAVCLEKCRSPVGFFMTHWAAGPTGALKMGLRHGLFCLGCCWALMLLLFVGGVMNLFWVLVLTVAVIVEKIFPWGRLVSKALGGVLLVAAAYLAISAYSAPTGGAMGSHAMGCMAGA